MRKSIRNVLITKLRHHGDVLLTSPVFSVLKKYHPDIQMDALVYQETAEMLTFHPAIRRVYTIDKQWKKLGFVAHIKKEYGILKKLRQEKYDLIIHLTENFRGCWIAWCCSIPNGITFCNEDRDHLWFWKKVFQYRVPLVARRHTVESHLDILRVLGVFPEKDERCLRLVSGAEADLSVEHKLRSRGWLGEAFIVVHPISRWTFKCWKTSAVAQMIDRLRTRGYTVVLSAAPVQKEKDMIDQIKKNLKQDVLDFSGELTLKQLASLIAKANLLVTVDSVPMHIASAMKTPVVALFGPSSEHVWSPWMVSHRIVVSGAHACRPCGKDGCGGSKISDCLQSISVEAVLKEIDSLLLDNAHEDRNCQAKISV